MVPRAIIDGGFLAAAKPTVGKVLLALLSHGDPGGNGFAIARSVLAGEAGVTLASFHRAVSALQGANILSVTYCPARCSSFRIRPLEEWCHVPVTCRFPPTFRQPGGGQ